MMTTTENIVLSDDIPYNPANVLINETDLTNILSQFSINKPPNDIAIYRKAFLHRSYCTRKNDNFLSGNQKCPPNCLPLQEESNERLEFLGDAIMNFVIADYLFERYPDVNEGFLTKMRTKLVNGNMMAHLSTKIGLGKFVIISQQIEANNGRTNKNILEDVFEAFIGAIYIDYNSLKINTSGKIPMLDGTGTGFQTVYKWIVGVIETFVDFTDLVKQKSNPKDKFVKQCQHNFQWTPKFYELDIAEKQNRKIHTVCVKNMNGDIIATGKGTSRKVAEFETASNALRYFGWN
jgi:dsRNA-specific ribonuclease